MEQTNSLASTASATSTAGLDAVLFQVGPVGVTGAGVQVHGAVAVVLGPDWISTLSFSLRGVVMALCPGLRLVI
jgi:hypothetical protein